MLLIYPLLFLLMYISNRKSHKPIYFGILLFFFVTSIGAFFLNRIDLYYKSITPSLEAILFHCLCLFILVRSYRDYDIFCNVHVIKIPPFILQFFTWFFMFCGFVAIWEAYPQVSINSIVGETQYLRTLLDEMGGQRSYFAFFGVKYWTIPMALGFYYAAYEPKRKLLIVLLFVASTCYIFDGLRFAGRECLMKYSIMFVLLFFLFKNKLERKTVRTFRVLIIVIGSIAVVLFGIITFMRFDASQVNQNVTTGGSLLSYISQGYINFSSVFTSIPKGLSGGRAHFPLFFQGTTKIETTIDLNLNTFSTCVGTWVKDGGIYFSLIITLVYSTLIRIISKIECNIFTLFYFSWAIEFCLSAPFFFNDTINGSRFISLILIILVDVFIRMNNANTKTK